MTAYLNASFCQYLLGCATFYLDTLRDSPVLFTSPFGDSLLVQFGTINPSSGEPEITSTSTCPMAYLPPEPLSYDEFAVTLGPTGFELDVLQSLNAYPHTSFWTFVQDSLTNNSTSPLATVTSDGEAARAAVGITAQPFNLPVQPTFNRADFANTPFEALFDSPTGG
jgi:hypothetical protein